MVIFRVFPVWKMFEKEQWLNNMACEGYHLRYVFLNILYMFDYSHPSHYKHLFFLLRSRGESMRSAYIGIIRQSHITIPTYLSIFTLVRLNSPVHGELQDFYSTRSRIILKYIREYILSLTLLLLLLFLTYIFDKSIGVLIIVLMGIFSIPLFYYLIAYIKQKKVYKKYR